MEASVTEPPHPLIKSQRTDGPSSQALLGIVSNCVPPNPLIILVLRTAPGFPQIQDDHARAPRHPLPTQNGPISRHSEIQLPELSDTLLSVAGLLWREWSSEDGPQNPRFFLTSKGVMGKARKILGVCKDSERQQCSSLATRTDEAGLPVKMLADGPLIRAVREE